MFKINSLGSSSKGNCFVIRDGISTILLDIGLPNSQIKSGLFDLKIGLNDLDGILITHAHQDHIQGVSSIQNCPKFMTRKTFEIGIKSNYLIDINETNFIKLNQKFKVGTFEIFPFPTKHDILGSCGFAIKNISNEKMVYLTDTGIANYNLKNAELYIIESNHRESTIKKRLKEKLIDQAFFNRISLNHLSAEKSVEYLKKNIGNKTKQIILMHLSPKTEKPIYVLNFVKSNLKFCKIEFVHPIIHKIQKEWKIGYEPDSKVKF